MENLNATHGTWLRNGAGPKPVNGGQWISGAALVPFSDSVPPANTFITTIDYDWSNRNLKGWDDQVSVRLHLQAGTLTANVDITSSTTGTVDITSSNFPANCTIWFQMKVGSADVGLYDPPYITEDQVLVYY